METNLVRPAYTGKVENSQLEIIGDIGCHNTLRRFMEKEKPCKILDVPSGEGILSKFLQKRGWDVHAADIDSGNFKIAKDHFKEVNLNKRLPYEDGSFDAVLCANGLHRLYNPSGAISEFNRILKPGGSLYINLNNYASFSKRLRFLFSGTIHNMITNTVCKQTIDDPEAHVRVPLLYSQLSLILEHHNLEVSYIASDVVKAIHKILYPLAMLTKGIAWVLPGSKRQFNDSFNSGIFPGGSYFFLKAVKKTLEE